MHKTDISAWIHISSHWGRDKTLSTDEAVNNKKKTKKDWFLFNQQHNPEWCIIADVIQGLQLIQNIKSNKLSLNGGQQYMCANERRRMHPSTLYGSF